LPPSFAGFVLQVLLCPKQTGVSSFGTLDSLRKALLYNAELYYSILKTTLGEILTWTGLPQNQGKFYRMNEYQSQSVSFLQVATSYQQEAILLS
jgi:hypothetical protein